jgi:putative membrane protein
VVATGVALWLASLFISGIRVGDGLDPLAALGTLAIMAVLIGLLDALATPLRRLLRGLADLLPLWIAAAVVLNTVLYWVAARAAAAAGLAVEVRGFGAALAGSLLVLVCTTVLAPLLTPRRR